VEAFFRGLFSRRRASAWDIAAGAKAPRGLKSALLALIAVVSASAANFTADSERGGKLFETLACIQCHSVNGRGGTEAPDLGKVSDRNFTPASLTATLWNHAPRMFAAMKKREIRAGDLNPQAAADLLAYFYAARFFERPGDASRGLRVFSEKRCADCHGLKTAKIPEARPVSEWQAIDQPIALVDAMWNHAAGMREQFAKRKWSWPELTSQELSDILVYLRGSSRPAGRIEITSGEMGKQIFESKTCSGCHHTALELAPRLRHMTLTDIAAALWNHQPKMSSGPVPMNVNEMGELVSYLWARQFFEDAGDAGRGRRVFTSKHCTSCHENGTDGAPKLPSASLPASGPEMISAMWHHGPGMMQQMQSKHIPWPRFTTAQMSNLIAYLNNSTK
jgi:mono/diheme cytochrome c family protein